MSDSRIEEYRQAVAALREGRFDFSLPTGETISFPFR